MIHQNEMLLAYTCHARHLTITTLKRGAESALSRSQCICSIYIPCIYNISAYEFCSVKRQNIVKYQSISQQLSAMTADNQQISQTVDVCECDKS